MPADLLERKRAEAEAAVLELERATGDDVILAGPVASEADGEAAGRSLDAAHVHTVVVVPTIATMAAFPWAAVRQLDVPVVIWTRLKPTRRPERCPSWCLGPAPSARPRLATCSCATGGSSGRTSGRLLGGVRWISCRPRGWLMPSATRCSPTSAGTSGRGCSMSRSIVSSSPAPSVRGSWTSRRTGRLRPPRCPVTAQPTWSQRLRAALRQRLVDRRRVHTGRCCRGAIHCHGAAFAAEP